MTPIDQIKERLNIVDVVSMYVTLTPAGKNMKARSPFTNEKTPSFFVSPDKGLYHCFSTGKGGDIFTFVEEMEGLDFKGALKVLAERAGVVLGKYDSTENKTKDRLYVAMEEATKFFEKSLEDSKEALEYLKSRGVEDRTIKDFRIGLAPEGWRNLYSYLKGRFSDEEILLAGLGKKPEEAGKEIYDTFRGRIMFPICDSSGRTIAFSGRILKPDEKSAKYVNSPDTPLFNKSDVLFALDKAKSFIRKYNFTTMVEGQFDVIMLHQAGFRNTVGVSGTALSESLVGRDNAVNNLGLVKRLSNNLILAFDSDEAGVKAARRSAMIGIRLGMDVKIVSMPGAKDPADFIKESGKEAWSTQLRGAVHVIEFLAEKIKVSAKDARDMGRRIVDEVLPLIAGLPSETEKSFFIRQVAEISGLSQAVLWQDLDKAKVPEEPTLPEISAKKPTTSRRSAIERKLFGIFYSKDADENIGKKLRDIMGEVRFEKLLTETEPIKDEVIFESEIYNEDPSEEALTEMLANLEEDYLSEEVEQLKTDLAKAESGGEDELAENLSQKHHLLSKRLSEIRNSRHLHKY